MYLGSGFAVYVCFALPRLSYPLIRLTVTFSVQLRADFNLYWISLLALVQYDLGWRLLYWRVLLFTEFFIIVEFHPHQTFCLLTNICGLIFSVWGVDKNFAQLEERDKLLKCWRRLQYPAQREQWTPNILQNFSLDDSIKQKSTKPWNPIIFFSSWYSAVIELHPKYSDSGHLKLFPNGCS